VKLRHRSPVKNYLIKLDNIPDNKRILSRIELRPAQSFVLKKKKKGQKRKSPSSGS
jgi:hypothetical protein